MRVKCIHKPTTPVPDRLLKIGYTAQTVFNVTFDRVYVAYGISIWKGELHYLLLNDETQRPDWFPAACFEVTDSKLPLSWHFAYWGHEPNADVVAVWGYAEMVAAGGKHYDNLIERETEALAVFQARRKEIDAAG